jgi:hypothetical protein
VRARVYTRPCVRVQVRERIYHAYVRAVYVCVSIGTTTVAGLRAEGGQKQSAFLPANLRYV